MKNSELLQRINDLTRRVDMLESYICNIQRAPIKLTTQTTSNGTETDTDLIKKWQEFCEKENRITDIIAL